MKTAKVAVLVGSLRRESFSLKIAKILKSVSPEELSLDVIDISELALYNQDLEDENREPASWKVFRDTIKKYDALLFVTPEHNRSVPAVLKNAIDIGSRPYGKSVWDGKPGAVVSVSPGAIGGFGANHHLRQTLVFLNVLTMPQPEAYIGSVHTLLDEKGKMTNAGALKFLTSFMSAFAKWAERHI